MRNTAAAVANVVFNDKLIQSHAPAGRDLTKDKRLSGSFDIGAFNVGGPSESCANFGIKIDAHNFV